MLLLYLCPLSFRFLGTPFFHSMVARSKASSSDVSVVIDPDTILLPDFIQTMKYAHKLDHDWLLFSSSKSVSHFPFHLDADGKRWFQDDGSRVKTLKVWLKGNLRNDLDRISHEETS